MREDVRCFAAAWYTKWCARYFLSVAFHRLENVRRTPGGIHGDTAEHRRAAGRMAAARAVAVRRIRAQAVR